MYRDFKIDDIPYDLKDVCDFMGIEMFIDFCDKFGGSHLYFPSKRSVLRLSRNREIKKSYNGRNSRELSHKFGISEMHLKSIIKED